MTISRRQMLMGSITLPFCGILPDLQLNKIQPIEYSRWEDRIAQSFIHAFFLDLLRNYCEIEELRNLVIYEDKTTTAKRRYAIYGHIIIHEPVHEPISSGQSYIIRDIVHVIDWGFQYKVPPQKVIDRCYEIIEEKLHEEEN